MGDSALRIVLAAIDLPEEGTGHLDLTQVVGRLLLSRARSQPIEMEIRMEMEMKRRCNWELEMEMEIKMASGK